MSTLNVLRTGVRGLSSAAQSANRGVFPSKAKYKKVMELQSQMTADDGLLVWQKRGFRDKLLYQISLGITILGFIPVGYALKTMAFPAKKD